MDSLDFEIIRCLRVDARATFAEIGHEVGLSPSAVKRRVDRIVATGGIRSFTVIVDPASLGLTTEAYVQVYCRGNVSPKQLREVLERSPEVVSACTVSGPADALVQILASSIEHLEQAIDRLRDQEFVDHTETTIVLTRLIDRPRSRAPEARIASTPPPAEG